MGKMTLANPKEKRNNQRTPAPARDELLNVKDKNIITVDSDSKHESVMMQVAKAKNGDSEKDVEDLPF